MQKIFLFLLCLLLPMELSAVDHCTDPRQYTVDRRCYVPDSVKDTKPYSAVVALIDDTKFVFCSGTIVQDEDGGVFLYTAKHCADMNKDGVLTKNITFRLYNGKKYDVTVNKNDCTYGKYNTQTKAGTSGDWLMCRLKVTDIPMINRTGKYRFGIDPFVPKYDVKLVGFGALKVMSDQEIQKFKQKYIEYLSERRIHLNGTESKYGWRQDGGLWIENDYVKDFITMLSKKEPKYYRDIFKDTDDLKVSGCEYSTVGKAYNCQGWGGNSGGGIFDKNGNIVGIHTRGLKVVGGTGHAESTGNVPLLQTFF